MKKRILSLGLTLCMVLTLLPVPALAAVGDLLDNLPTENAALLDELSRITGGDSDQVKAMLGSMGLLDENGELDLSQSILLDGRELALDEVMALLEDPSADLGRVADVDGTPISLGDLKTILQIERELARIQETYFSGRVFAGESLNNLNNLMDQLETEGITLRGGGTLPAANVLDLSGLEDPVGELGAGAGSNLNVTYSLPDCLTVPAGEEVGFTCTRHSGMLGGSQPDYYVEIIIYRKSDFTGTQARMFSRNTSSSESVTLPEGTYSFKFQFSVNSAGVENTQGIDGNLRGFLEFSDPRNMVFSDGTTVSDIHHTALTVDKTGNALYLRDEKTGQKGYQPYVTSMEMNGNTYIPPNDKPPTWNLAYTDSAKHSALAATATQIFDTADATILVDAGLDLYVSKRFEDPSSAYWMEGALPVPYYDGDYGELPYEHTSYTWQGLDVVAVGAKPMAGNPGSDYTQTPYVNIKEGPRSTPAPVNVSIVTEVPYRNSRHLLPTQLRATWPGAPSFVKGPVPGGSSSSVDIGSLRDYRLEGGTFSIYDVTPPEIVSYSVPAGTYSSGKLVPITLNFSEPVITKNATFSINGQAYSAADLKVDTTGKRAVAWYTVKAVDDAELTVTKITGLKDLCGNAMDTVNFQTYTAPDVALESALMRNAVESASAAYANGEASIELTVNQASQYRTKYADEEHGGYASFRAVVTAPDGAQQTAAFTLTEPADNTIVPVAVVKSVNAADAEQTYTVKLYACENKEDPGTRLIGRGTSFTVPAKINVTGVTVSAATHAELTELSMAETDRPTLTAAIVPESASYKTGTWTSSDPAIAGVESVNGVDTVVLGSKVGKVALAYTADNGTPADKTDDVKSSNALTYTVVAGGSPALVIPASTSAIVARRNSPATVLWSSNAAAFTSEDFQYTVELFAGNYTGEELAAALAGTPPPAPVWSGTAAKGQNSIVIPENILTETSGGTTPAYTVRVSMPHPKAVDETLTALCWILVNPQPAGAKLTPESLYLTDGGTAAIHWEIVNYEPGSTDAALTITRVTGDSEGEPFDALSITEGSGSYTLAPSRVDSSSLKETYMVALSVQNPGDAAPNVDAFPLYVYREGALALQTADGAPLGEKLTLDNTAKVAGYANGGADADQIQALREELALIEYVSINYGDYSWSQLSDRIKWASDGKEVSVNYKQGGLYENIELFSLDSYLPETKLALSSVTDGTARITATHANTGMSDSVTVDVHTLRDQFFLFQLTPMLKTTLTYTDGAGASKSVETNDDGTLALYEPNGIGSDLSLKAEDAEGHVYLGTIYKENFLSGERDATKLQLYPLNTFKLRRVAEVALSVTKPDGSPFDGSATLRGGVYKNGGHCQNALLGGSPGSLKDGGLDQTVNVQNGTLTVYLDSTQFWSAEKGETRADAAGLAATDNLQYVFELTGIGGGAYYPMLVYANGNLTIQDVMRSAGSVLALERVPDGRAEQPFLSNQTMDYGLSGSRLVDVRGFTGHVGPNSVYPTATLRTTMLLWGEKDVKAADYTVTVADEYGFVPVRQTSKIGTYPFSSIPVVYNDLTLSQAAVTDSGWVADGADVGLRVRLNRQSALLTEQALPFRLMDMTRVEKVTESDNVSNMLVTLTAGSTLEKGKSEGNGNVIVNLISGLVGDLSGPVDGTNFKMIISPSEDNTKFKAFIWAGYDSMGLDEIDYSASGLALDYGLMEGKLSVAPGIGDMTAMAKGRSDAQSAGTRTAPAKGWGKNPNFGGQLEGYYEAEIAYNFPEKKWEIYTLGGGFTAGFSGGMTVGISAWVGPIPLTAEFGFGGAVQLDFKAAARYSEQDGLAWDASVTGGTVNDYLTTLRLNAYVNAFGGIGIDYSIVALKIGVFGEVQADSSNRFLSRTYLADPNQRQLNGQQLGLTGEVGVKFKASLLFFSYELVLASGSAGYTWQSKNLNYINDYWQNAGSGKSMMAAAAAYAAQNGLGVAGAAAKLQERDYLEQYERTWYGGGGGSKLRAMDAHNALELLQSNANPQSYPMVTDDGQLLVYIDDGDSASIYDSRVHTAGLSGNSYSPGGAIAGPDDFGGYGDSDAALAGSGDFAAAAWVRLGTRIEGKDAGDAITPAEQSLLMNGMEIAASIWDGGHWTSTRLTTDATPDLAPAVAVGGGKAIAVWRSVYAGGREEPLNPDGLLDPLDFSAKDVILYRMYDGSDWGETKELYNGTAGAVKGLQAAMLPDGTAAAAYTLDRNSGDGSSSDYEIAYTMVDSAGTRGATMVATSDGNLDENPQIVAANFGEGDDRFVIGWHSAPASGSTIRLLAVDADGVMSNRFPASVSQMAEHNDVTIGGEFRFAGMDGDRSSLDNLTILWPETVTVNGRSDHSVLKAVKFRAAADGAALSAAPEMAELDERTLLDHFDAYVSDGNQVRAVLQGTWYDPDDSEIIDGVSVALEKTKLYTATGDFANRAAVTGILPDYANLALNSRTAVQFTLFNAGLEDITAANITLDGTNYPFDGLALAPNESAALTVWCPVGGEVKDLPYTVTADFGTDAGIEADAGTVHLDYPDVGVSRMEPASEAEGVRTLRMTLYNQSAAALAGGKNRSVVLSFCTDGLYDELAAVTSSTPSVTVNPDKTLTVSGGENLKLIDQGAFTLEAAFNVGAYVAGMTDGSGNALTEIPDSGVRLFAKAAVLEDKNTLPEYDSANNESTLRFDSLLKRTNETVTLSVEQGTSGTGSTAAVTLRNNSLQPQTAGGAVVATLLDADGNVLEQKRTGINADELTGEGTRRAYVTFTKLGSRVAAAYGVLSADPDSTELASLRFEGLAVSLSDFTADGDGNYAASVTTSATSTLVSAIAAGAKAAVSVNGAAVTQSTEVPLPAGTSVITVSAAAGGRTRTYTLTILRPGSGGGSGGGGGGSSGGGGGVSGTADMPFLDVSADAYYYDAVRWAVDRKVASGVSAEIFAPNAACTRAQTVAFLWRAMGSPEPAADANPFADVSADAYFNKAVLWAVEQGVTQGTGEAAFSPNATCTRAQAAAFLYRAAGAPAAAAGASFTDVSASAYYAKAVAWAAGEGITGGTGNNKFSPNTLCTRAQIVTFLYRYLGA